MIKKAFSIVLVLAVMLSLCAVVRAEGANTEIDPGKLYIKTPDGKLLEVEKGEEFFLTFYTSGYKPIGIVQGRLDLDGSIFSVIDKELGLARILRLFRRNVRVTFALDERTRFEN